MQNDNMNKEPLHQLADDKISVVVAELNLNPDDYTKKGKRVLFALDELEAAKLKDDRPRIIYWAGFLIQVVGNLTKDYLFKEAQDILWEKDGS